MDRDIVNKFHVWWMLMLSTGEVVNTLVKISVQSMGACYNRKSSYFHWAHLVASKDGKKVNLLMNFLDLGILEIDLPFNRYL